MTSCATLKCPNPHGVECHCSACHRTFTSPAGFTEHQTITRGLECHDPAGQGMVLRERRGIAMWGHPIDEAAVARLAAARNAPGRAHHGAQSPDQAPGVVQDTPRPENGPERDGHGLDADHDDGEDIAIVATGRGFMARRPGWLSRG